MTSLIDLQVLPYIILTKVFGAKHHNRKVVHYLLLYCGT